MRKRKNSGEAGKYTGGGARRRGRKHAMWNIVATRSSYLDTTHEDNERKRKIRAFFFAHKRMPSFTELMQLANYTSRSSAAKLARRLSLQGFLSQDRTGRLAQGSRFFSLSVLGTVAAGFPSPAEEYRSDHLSLDEYLIPKRDAAYLLTVQGDSMKDAGIVEGDLVIVERGALPRTGDIVIAEIDGAWTMKYYREKHGRVCLEAANAAYPTIFPHESMRIEAIVRGVIRKYR